MAILRRYLLAGLLGLGALAGAHLAAAAPTVDEPAAPPPSASPSASPPADSPADPSPPAASPPPPAAPRSATAPPPGSWAAPAGIVVTPGIDVIGQYSLRFYNDAAGQTAWFHEVELPRGHASISARYNVARARFVLEAVRSASEGALLGVAGDSLVMRVREAYAGVTLEDLLEIRLGVVPTLTVGPIESAWGARTVAPAAMERTGLATPADLGGTIRYSLPRGFGWLAAGAYNGEGYTRRELNRGKNLELAAEVRPLASLASARPLAIMGSYVIGSTGTGRARADRITAALLWEGGGDVALGAAATRASSFADRARGGVALTYALGVDGDGARKSLLVDAFLRVEPVDRLIFAVDASSWDLDVAIKSDAITTLTAAIGYRIVDPLEAFLVVDRTIADGLAAAVIPGLDVWRLRAATRVTF